MANKRIVILSDIDMHGSGYFHIATNVALGLSKLGYEVKIIGMGYKGEEHTFPFTIIPCAHFEEARAMFNNLCFIWKPTALIVAMDISVHALLLGMFEKYHVPYIGIFPIEADPLCLPWAMVLMQMDQPFVISEFGLEECQRMGIEKAKYFRIGIDTDAWRMPTSEERAALRKSFQFDEKTFVILTVADNQERKNLSRAMEIIAQFKLMHPEIPMKYMLVTREHLAVGWELRDLARVRGIQESLILFERGIPFRELWSLYAVADAFLLSSKAEGCAIPLLEAMACGVPVAATDATAMRDHIRGGRGFPIKPDYSIIDPFGNGNRYFASISRGAMALERIYTDKVDMEKAVNAARKYVEKMTWDEPILLLDEAIQCLAKPEEKNVEEIQESKPA